MTDLETARQLVYEQAGDSPPLNEALVYMDAAIAMESAAPEMLKALELVLSDTCHHDIAERVHRTINSAIAKAKSDE